MHAKRAGWDQADWVVTCAGVTGELARWARALPLGEVIEHALMLPFLRLNSPEASKRLTIGTTAE
jgi:hypothetical protein